MNMGPAGRPAVPSLRALLDDESKAIAAGAMTALYCIGPYSMACH